MAEGVWVVLGLVPAMMFVTGMLMWWNRVVRQRLRGSVVARQLEPVAE